MNPTSPQQLSEDHQNHNQTTQTTATNKNQPLSSLSLSQQQQQKVKQLRTWMTQKGCIIHPNVQIPSYVNGFQGVGTTAPIPPKTLIVAIPSSLILTVTKCYKSPQLKSIFTKNDDLFDYEASDDAEFNVLCVFLMYHKMNIQTSEWRVYLQTIGDPQTAIDWPDHLLKGLNKSTIEQILHVRLQCDKLRDQLSAYLATTSQFSRFSLDQIKHCFNYCYRAVMTRCFGYYFGQSSLIPVADLINHGCEVVDHQLVNVRYEKNVEFCEAYKEKSDKIDCELLGVKRGAGVGVPFRERFLLSNGLIDNDLQTLSHLDRNKIDTLIAAHNNTLFHSDPSIDITHLQFCQEDDSQDNDTDVDQQHQRQMEFQRLHLEELEQIENFRKYHEGVKVERYGEVEERWKEYERRLGEQGDDKGEGSTEVTDAGQSRNDLFIQGVKEERLHNGEEERKEGNNPKEEEDQGNEEDWEDQDEDQTGSKDLKSNNKATNRPMQQTNPSHKQPQSPTLPIQSPAQQSQQQPLFFSHKPPTPTPPLPPHSPFHPSTSPNPKAIVPIQMVDSSQSQSQDDQQWGLQPDSYFTFSTNSAVAANKELYNSYGSRTNKFLLVWYGFCYRNNLFDSVSLRLHVKFTKEMPQAKDMVLDTYIGGQGMAFRKGNNSKEMVQANEVSRQFRLKLTKPCTSLLTFLRLYLLDYYKGPDLYKLCVTLPSSITFQLLVLSFYKQILQQLYQRYPLSVIEGLKKEMGAEGVSEKDRQRIMFKVVYLEEQRRILDEGVEWVGCAVAVWGRVRGRKEQREREMRERREKKQERMGEYERKGVDGGEGKGDSEHHQQNPQFDKSFYEDFTMHQLRKLKPYLTQIKNNYQYVLYQQKQQQQQKINRSQGGKQQSQQQQKKQQ